MLLDAHVRKGEWGMVNLLAGWLIGCLVMRCRSGLSDRCICPCRVVWAGMGFEVPAVCVLFALGSCG